LLGLFIIAPFVVSLPFGVVIMNVMASALFLVGIYAVSERKRLFLVTLILAAISAVLSWMVLIVPRASIVLAAQSFLTLLLGLFAVSILKYVLRRGRVTADKIYAAICVYPSSATLGRSPTPPWSN
jgi:TctA family transporter